MSGREREVVLEGPGPPWGFRITGGADTLQDLKVERGEGGEDVSSSNYLIIGRSVVLTRAVWLLRE